MLRTWHHCEVELRVRLSVVKDGVWLVTTMIETFQVKPSRNMVLELSLKTLHESINRSIFKLID